MRSSRTVRGGIVLLSASAFAVLLAGCGPRGRPPPTEQPPTAQPATPYGADGYTVGMAGGRFFPDDLIVPAGQTVTFINTDKVKHAVVPDVADSGGPDSDGDFPRGMKTGETFQWIAPTSVPVGTRYYYHCRYRGSPGDGANPGTRMAGVLEIGPPALRTGPQY